MLGRRIGSLALAAALASGAFGCSGGGSPPPSSPDTLDPPMVDTVLSPTNQSPLTLTGSAHAGAMVQVRGGAQAVVSADVGADGHFSVDVPLVPNAPNTLLVSQVMGTTESTATTVMVVHDDMAPDAPMVDPVTSPTRRPQTRLRGSAEPGATILVTGGAEDAMGPVDDTGRFDLMVTLSTSVASITENDLSVKARDAAGNESPAVAVTIVNNPNLPLDAPLLDAAPGYTSSPTLTLTGQADPNITISVAGGASAATATADGTGAFSVDVDLRPNTTNTLSVFAVNTATGESSPPATLVIVHDDMPPEPPALDPQPSPTGATVAHVSGTSEANAAIDIAGGATEAMGTADADGAFRIDVMLTPDATNDLSVTATDRAGNTSDPATVSIQEDSSLEAPVDVNPIPSPTSDNPITLSGTTEPMVDVQIMGGASPVTVTSGADGSFSTSVMLNANTRNELHVQRVSGTVETIVVVVQDSLPPEAPMVDTIPSPTSRTDITVSGASEPDARIAISGGASPASGTADGTGRFSVPVTLAMDSTSTLNVIATDRAGNASSPTTVMVTQSSSVPDAPVVDDPSPPPTNVSTLTVTGHITMPASGITIDITGGAADATGPTDPSTGAFSIDVMLTANASNELHVVSVDGAIDSPPAIVTVTEDEMPPDAPDSTHIAVASGSSLSCTLGGRGSVNVTGGAMAAEALSTVHVQNRTATGISTTVSAASDGSFSTSIQACSGDLLRFTATDAAGNTSAPTEITVM